VFIAHHIKFLKEKRQNIFIFANMSFFITSACSTQQLVSAGRAASTFVENSVAPFNFSPLFAVLLGSVEAGDVVNVMNAMAIATQSPPHAGVDIRQLFSDGESLDEYVLTECKTTGAEVLGGGVGIACSLIGYSYVKGLGEFKAFVAGKGEGRDVAARLKKRAQTVRCLKACGGSDADDEADEADDCFRNLMWCAAVIDHLVPCYSEKRLAIRSLALTCDARSTPMLKMCMGSEFDVKVLTALDLAHMPTSFSDTREQNHLGIYPNALPAHIAFERKSAMFAVIYSAIGR
jgi:hypothetical protein